MKVTPDDPALTAYVLGELDEAAKLPVTRALAADEKLREEEAALSSLAGLLSATLGGEALSLGVDRVAEIHKAGSRPDSKVLVMEHRKRAKRQSFMVVAGVAAMVVIGFVVLSQFDVGKEPGISGADVAGAGAAGSGGSDFVAGDSQDLPGGFVPDQSTSIGLPLMVNQADPSMVERALAESGALPSRDQFLVADWINVGRVTEKPQMVIHGLGVSYELGPCSWNPAASLLMIHVRPLGKEPIKLDSVLNFDPLRVKEVQLTGGAGQSSEQAASTSEISSPKTFLYELDLFEGGGEIGSLTLQVGKKDAREIALTGPVLGKDEVSTAFTTAGILGDYARWGASEGRDRETLIRLVREAKELLGKVADESTRYALDMILISEEALGAE